MVSDTIILLKSKCIYIYKSKKNNLIKIDVLFWIKNNNKTKSNGNKLLTLALRETGDNVVDSN